LIAHGTSTHRDKPIPSKSRISGIALLAAANWVSAKRRQPDLVLAVADDPRRALMNWGQSIRRLLCGRR
jgi:hypothetical protein